MLARLLIVYEAHNAAKWQRWMEAAVKGNMEGDLFRKLSLVAFAAPATAFNADVALHDFYGEEGWDLMVVSGEPNRFSMDDLFPMRKCPEPCCWADFWGEVRLLHFNAQYMLDHPLESDPVAGMTAVDIHRPAGPYKPQTWPELRVHDFTQEAGGSRTASPDPSEAPPGPDPAPAPAPSEPAPGPFALS
jgi:hypothetical protein